MVPWIAAQDGPTVDEVCQRFALSRRKLIEDLEVLMMVGVPPYTPTRSSTWSSRATGCGCASPTCSPRPLHLTPEQGLALVAAGSGSQGLPGGEPHGPPATALRQAGRRAGRRPGRGGVGHPRRVPARDARRAGHGGGRGPLRPHRLQLRPRRAHHPHGRPPRGVRGRRRLVPAGVLPQGPRPAPVPGRAGGRHPGPGRDVRPGGGHRHGRRRRRRRSSSPGRTCPGDARPRPGGHVGGRDLPGRRGERPRRRLASGEAGRHRHAVARTPARAAGGATPGSSRPTCPTCSRPAPVPHSASSTATGAAEPGPLHRPACRPR